MELYSKCSNILCIKNAEEEECVEEAEAEEEGDEEPE
jgi:hypothetical protein